MIHHHGMNEPALSAIRIGEAGLFVLDLIIPDRRALLREVLLLIRP